ncbi:MAG: metallophosphoesterase [Clostridiales bacterium]|jgi:hypothetical protein|nr:metallophosphoesterase [Clostridiales bacterium]
MGEYLTGSEDIADTSPSSIKLSTTSARISLKAILNYSFVDFKIREYYAKVADIVTLKNRLIKEANSKLDSQQLINIPKISDSRETDLIKKLRKNGLLRPTLSMKFLKVAKAETHNYGPEFADDTMRLFQKLISYSNSKELQKKVQENKGKFIVIGDIHGNFFALARPLLESGLAKIGDPPIIYVNNETFETYDSFDEAMIKTQGDISKFTLSLNWIPREDFDSYFNLMGDYIDRDLYSEEIMIAINLLIKRINDMRLAPEHSLMRKITITIGNHEIIEAIRFMGSEVSHVNVESHNPKFESGKLIIEQIANGNFVLFRYCEEPDVIIVHASLDRQDIFNILKAILDLDKSYRAKFSITEEQIQEVNFFKGVLWGNDKDGRFKTPDNKRRFFDLLNLIFKNICSYIISEEPRNFSEGDIEAVYSILHNIAHAKYVIKKRLNNTITDLVDDVCDVGAGKAENIGVGDSLLVVGHTKFEEDPELFNDRDVRILATDCLKQHKGSSIMTYVSEDSRSINSDTLTQSEFLTMCLTLSDSQVSVEQQMVSYYDIHELEIKLLKRINRIKNMGITVIVLGIATGITMAVLVKLEIINIAINSITFMSLTGSSTLFLIFGIIAAILARTAIINRARRLNLEC